MQRIGAQAVIEGFHTVACCVAELEAGMDPVILRNHNQQRAAWIRWHIRPESHRFWKVKTALSTLNKRWIFPLQKIAQKFSSVDISRVEKIGPYARHPDTCVCTIIIPDKKSQAIKLAKS